MVKYLVPAESVLGIGKEIFHSYSEEYDTLKKRCSKSTNLLFALSDKLVFKSCALVDSQETLDEIFGADNGGMVLTVDLFEVEPEKCEGCNIR